MPAIEFARGLRSLQYEGQNGAPRAYESQVERLDIDNSLDEPNVIILRIIKTSMPRRQQFSQRTSTDERLIFNMDTRFNIFFLC